MVDHVNVFLFFFSFVLLCFIATVMFGEAERRPSFLSVSCVMLFIYIYGFLCMDVGLSLIIYFWKYELLIFFLIFVSIKILGGIIWFTVCFC